MFNSYVKLPEGNAIDTYMTWASTMIGNHELMKTSGMMLNKMSCFACLNVKCPRYQKHILDLSIEHIQQVGNFDA
jgi:hypothetical protein